MTKTLVVAAIFLCALGAYEALAQDADPRTSFFLTSVGPGKGVDLGGLAGADQYCQNLAESVAGTKPGTLTSLPRARGPSTRGIASARGPGTTPKGLRLPRTSMTFIQIATISPRTRCSTKRARWSRAAATTPIATTS